MSCEHGNHIAGCDLCDALDEKWDSGYKAGSQRADKLLLLLREADTAIAMLDINNSAAATRNSIATELGAV